MTPHGGVSGKTGVRRLQGSSYLLLGRRRERFTLTALPAVPEKRSPKFIGYSPHAVCLSKELTARDIPVAFRQRLLIQHLEAPLMKVDVPQGVQPQKLDTCVPARPPSGSPQPPTELAVATQRTGLR